MLAVSEEEMGLFQDAIGVELARENPVVYRAKSGSAAEKVDSSNRRRRSMSASTVGGVLPHANGFEPLTLDLGPGSAPAPLPAGGASASRVGTGPSVRLRLVGERRGGAGAANPPLRSRGAA